MKMTFRKETAMNKLLEGKTVKELAAYAVKHRGTPEAAEARRLISKSMKQRAKKYKVTRKARA